MRQTFDTDATLFQVLKATNALVSEISGGIYVDQRPDDSVKEDIVINTITLSQEYFPQIGTSNINVHVSDKVVTVGGKQQKVADRERLKLISGLVLNAIRSTVIRGLTMTIENQVVIQEAEIAQHYVNIRINWNIHA